MAKAQVFDARSGDTSSLDLEGPRFTTEPNEHVIHRAVVAELDSRRRYTASTKGRSEIRGSGAKLYRQKGTGRARAGALSTPQRYGGGVAFAPKPRHYVVKVNRKARRRALRSALSVHAGRGSLGMADPGALDAPSTKQAADALGKLEGEGRVLLVCGGEGEDTVIKSFRNLSGLECKPATDVGVADVIGAARLVLTPNAADYLTRIASKERATEEAST
jgi:large subunit ribosomal protein L4